MSPIPFILVILSCIQLQTTLAASFNFPLIEETLEVIAKDAIRGATKEINDGGILNINLLNATRAASDEDLIVLEMLTNNSDSTTNKTRLEAAKKYINLHKGEDYAKDIAFAAINVMVNELIKALGNVNIFD